MFGPAYIDTLTFFYPIGNTPAACLTRDLPPESDADILLLGCGDVRNILFTLYSQRDSSRKLDFTCCDIQEAVVARNILLCTLVLDDTAGSKNRAIWNIYYHFYLDEQCIKILSDQAKKLVSLSSSINEWHSTIYGRKLRFCDSSTLFRVRALWKAYCILDLEKSQRDTLNCLLETNIQHARDVKAHFVGENTVTTGTRSAAPFGIPYLEIANKLYQHYWTHGSLSQDPKILAKTIHPNPLFAYHATKTSVLHYGTDPLLGFHLATAFAPLATKSPFKATPSKTSFGEVVGAAQLQFQMWCNTLRRGSGKTVIRFFAGDAIAFARSLHHTKVTGHSHSANIYRDAYHFEPIQLENEEYQSAPKAPSSFTVIDTSNLIDHLGAVNLLSATSPLLKDDRYSSLYTETLVKREKDYKAYADFLLCGDFSTVSLLLELFPLEYWTNLSSSSPADETLLQEAMRLTGAGRDGQMGIKLTWKRLTPLRNTEAGIAERRLRFSETDLAQILYTIYQNMFQHENMLSLFEDFSSLKTRKNSILHYHRGSFACFLRLVHSRVIVDWHKVMEQTFQLIESDSSTMMGTNYIQELYLYVHLLGLYSVETLSKPTLINVPKVGGISKWENLPSVVCITLKVPRKSWSVLSVRDNPRPATPIAHCLVQSSPRAPTGQWQNIFSAIQMVFGTVKSTGTRHSNNFAIHISEDPLRWNGDSPLLVSFNVPSWFLLLEPRTAIVAFGLQSTPYSSVMFMQSLGLEMNVYKTTLGNEEEVYITKHSPSLTGAMAIHGFSDGERKTCGPPKPDFENTTTARAIKAEGRITSLVSRMNLLSDGLKDKLRSGCAIKSTQIAPCEFVITLADDNIGTLQFPVPVVGSRGTTRIARKSSYVEVEAPIHATPWTSFPTFISRQHLDKGYLASPCIHYLDMDILPVLDTTRLSQLKWLITHISGMFSGRERTLREQSLSAASSGLDARISFKDSLFSLFMHFTGLQGEQSRVFGLNDPSNGGVHIMIFVSCMRLDLGGQTVVLDTAILPLTKDLLPRIEKFLVAMSTYGFVSIKVDSKELEMWKHILPSFAERCRDWKHRHSCIGITGQRARDGDSIFCSCGRGILPADFIQGVPGWSDVAKFTTRAAITPIFSVPIVDAPFGVSTLNQLFLKGCGVCGKENVADGGRLLRCSACREAKYCSSECQRVDWKRHKRHCNKRGH